MNQLIARTVVATLILACSGNLFAALRETYTFQNYSTSSLRAELHREENWQGYPYYNLLIKVVNNTSTTFNCSASIGVTDPGFNVTDSGMVNPSSTETIVTGVFSYEDRYGPSNQNSVSCREYVEAPAPEAALPTADPTAPDPVEDAEEELVGGLPDGSGAPSPDNSADSGATNPPGEQLRVEMTCPCSWVLSGTTINFDIARITNNMSQTTGPLTVKLWATDQPYVGGQISGYVFASSSFDNRLGVNEYFEDVRGEAPFDPPPEGTYFVSMAVQEMVGGQEFIVDHVTFDDPQYFTGTSDNREVVFEPSVNVSSGTGGGSVSPSLLGLLAIVYWAFRKIRHNRREPI